MFNISVRKNSRNGTDGRRSFVWVGPPNRTLLRRMRSGKHLTQKTIQALGDLHVPCIKVTKIGGGLTHHFKPPTKKGHIAANPAKEGEVCVRWFLHEGVPSKIRAIFLFNGIWYEMRLLQWILEEKWLGFFLLAFHSCVFQNKTPKKKYACLRGEKLRCFLRKGSKKLTFKSEIWEAILSLFDILHYSPEN